MLRFFVFNSILLTVDLRYTNLYEYALGGDSNSLHRLEDNLIRHRGLVSPGRYGMPYFLTLESFPAEGSL